MNGLNTVLGLILHVAFKNCHHALPIIILECQSIGVLLLSYYKDIWEVSFVLKLLLVEVDLSFVDHHDSLLVVMGIFVFDNSVIGITDNCNDEVHENHEKIEDGHNIHEPGKAHYQVTVNMLSVSILDIESRVIFK